MNPNSKNPMVRQFAKMNAESQATLDRMNETVKKLRRLNETKIK